MIGKLNGVISHIKDKYLIVDVSGVGYKVFVSENTLRKNVVGNTIEIFTHLNVREDALDLYGFETMDELDVFEMLLSVSGIGPKSALGIINVSSIETLASAVGRGDIAYLTKVSGIGRKTAEKIVLELRDKIGSFAKGDHNNGDSDTLDALLALGYKDHEIREALKEISPEVQNPNERIREALKLLGK